MITDATTMKGSCHPERSEGSSPRHALRFFANAQNDTMQNI
jgi:hypothetical protein